MTALTAPPETSRLTTDDLRQLYLDESIHDLGRRALR
jgi:hypothetical protein